MKRQLLLNLQLWKTKHERLPLVLKGARQVGKTYILKEFGEQNFRRSHYLNFEEDETVKKVFLTDLKVERILRELSFHLNSDINPEQDLLIFDEVQYCPRVLTSLKYFAENLPQLAVAAAGSLLGVMLSKDAFPVGKVEFLNLFPMDFHEFLNGVDEKKAGQFLSEYKPGEEIPEIIHLRLWELFKHYLVCGGLPKVIDTYRREKNDLFAATEKVRDRQTDLINSYCADIAKHSGIENAMHITRVWENIPLQLARESDGSSGKFTFQGVLPGKKGYVQLAGPIDWLTAAGLIHRVSIANSAKLPIKAFTKDNFFKLYLFDVGILAALSRMPAKVILNYDFGSYKGYVAENFVIQELHSAGVDECFSWKENTAEIELLFSFDEHLIPIEIKSGHVTQAKSLKVFAEKYQPPLKVVLSGKNFYFDRTKKTCFVPLYLAGRLKQLIEYIL